MNKVNDLLKPGVDLSNCDREPIHIPGAIQAHGYLFALRESDLGIVRASHNAATLFGLPLEQILGQSLPALFDAASAARLRAAAPLQDLAAVAPLRLSLSEERVFDAVLHRSGGRLIVELEPAASLAEVRFTDFHQVVHHIFTGLKANASVETLCEATAQEVRLLTGFDRVMVYRFDRDWHGTVIGEAKREDLEPFLGHHYPASDIPVQARRLYTLNWLRFIVDVASPRVPLVDAPDEAASPLDLSFSVLRSVSPVHIEYLRNMGVKASLSISILRGDELWGLIACHHYSSAHLVPYATRLACEFLGQALSWQVATRESSDVTVAQMRCSQIKDRLVARITRAPSLDQALAEGDDDLLLLADATGCAVRLDGELRLIGRCPPRVAVEQLLTFAAKRGSLAPYATHELSAELAVFAPFSATSSGALVVLMVGGKEDGIAWFRPEQVREVRWAGAARAAAWAGTPVRLSPGGSFALWSEIVKAKARPWQPWELGIAEQLLQALRDRMLATTAEIKVLNAELKAASLAKDEFLATVSHELRTPLNSMLGWLQLFEVGDIGADEVPTVIGTLKRNALAQQKLIEDLLDVSRIISGKMRLEVQELNAFTVVKAALEAGEPAALAKDIKIHSILDPTTGSVRGDPARLQQVVWNLVSNAIKFTPKRGRIVVTLARGPSSIIITVEDNGEGIAADFLPYVFDRFRQAEGGESRRYQGLGLGLAISRQLIEMHGGTIRVASAGQGLGSAFTVQLPMAAVQDHKVDAMQHSAAPVRLGEGHELEGLKIVIVDDEEDSRTFVARVLRRCGATCLVAANAVDALQLIDDFRPDILVSDIGMAEVNGYELISRLRTRSVEAGGQTPAIALTAYARSEDRTRALNAGFQTHIAKPIAQAELLAVVASLAGRRLV